MTISFVNGFATSSGEITVHIVNKDGIYVDSVSEYVVVGSGLSAGAYLDPPPVPKSGFVIKRENDKWEYVEDHRDEVVYSTIDKREIIINDVGKYPENTTTLKPLCEHCEWNGGEWILSQEKRSEILKSQQAEMWEKIKKKRYENSLGGVFIERVGKWFQTGEEEKTKYLGLDKVIDSLGEIDWKCYDNSFIKMDRTLLNEIFLAMVVSENADHINAEKHRAEMLKSADPLNYDFSTGWSANYEE